MSGLLNTLALLAWVGITYVVWFGLRKLTDQKGIDDGKDLDETNT